MGFPRNWVFDNIQERKNNRISSFSREAFTYSRNMSQMKTIRTNCNSENSPFLPFYPHLFPFSTITPPPKHLPRSPLKRNLPPLLPESTATALNTSNLPPLPTSRPQLPRKKKKKNSSAYINHPSTKTPPSSSTQPYFLSSRVLNLARNPP